MRYWAGAYQVVVANAAGSVTSAPVALTILVPPTITTAPVPLTRIVGEAASFTVVATGTDPLGFQWRFNGVAIGGATAPVYNIATTTTGSAGAYQVVVANAAGSVTSAPVALTILVPPAITTAPVPLTRIVGEAASFTVVATGTDPLGFQWRLNGTAIGGATAPVYNIASTTTGSAGAYQVVVANAAGSVTSAPVALTVLVPPAITTTPVPLTRIVGEAASFTVVATGTDPLGFQWRLNGAAIGGATAPVYYIAATTSDSAGASQVVVANAAGSVTSAPVALTILVPPAITTAPVPLTRIVGEAASFTVVATGTDPLGFQWRLNGTAIGGATAATYDIAAVAPSDAGLYDVEVRNGAGTLHSPSVSLTVINAGAAARLVLEMSADTGLLHLHVTGTPGAAYRVEESVDLDLWSFVTSGVCGDDGTFVVELGLPADVSARCFRAMAE